MRQLLNTLFVTSEDIYLSLDGENVVASREHQEAARYPLHTDRREYLGKRPAPACPVPHGGRALRQLPHCPQYDLRQGL